MTYEDPENIFEICKDIVSCPTIQGILDKLKEIFPTFIKHTKLEYSKDYPHFDVNWRAMCTSLNTRKAYILLVDEFVEDDSHILIKTFCEVLTQAGFVVRPESSYVVCPSCDSVIPSFEMYNKMKLNRVRVPHTWSNQCIDCSRVSTVEILQ